MKIDGLFYVIGLFLGFLVFGETVTGFWGFFNDGGFMGRFTLHEWLGVDRGVVVFAIVLLALGMFVGAEKVEKIFRARRNGGVSP